MAVEAVAVGGFAGYLKWKYVVFHGFLSLRELSNGQSFWTLQLNKRKNRFNPGMKQDAGRIIRFFIFWRGFRGLHGCWFFCWLRIMGHGL